MLKMKETNAFPQAISFFPSLALLILHGFNSVLVKQKWKPEIEIATQVIVGLFGLTTNFKNAKALKVIPSIALRFPTAHNFTRD